ncbi:MAG: DinB family protein [Acidobacteriia bacterium]|nr:DinB family protein [Terriglobia bacterium]
MIRLEQILDSWKAIRRDTIAAVEDFPPGEFDFRPTPEVMAFGEIARHILDASHGLVGMLLAGEEDFTRPDFREKMRMQMPALPRDAGQTELAVALGDSLEGRAAELAARPPDFFAHIVTRMDGQRLTRMEMVQMIKEHELTHRAQLFLYLRLKGIVPATTRRRMAKQAAK